MVVLRNEKGEEFIFVALMRNENLPVPFYRCRYIYIFRRET